VQGDQPLDHIALCVPALASGQWRRDPSPVQTDPRGGPDRRLCAPESRSCWEGSWCSGRSRRSICGSTTAQRCPDLAMCQASSLPPAPLPRTSIHSVRVGTSSTPWRWLFGRPRAVNANARRPESIPYRGLTQHLRARPEIIESTFDRVRYGFTTDFPYHILW